MAAELTPEIREQCRNTLAAVEAVDLEALVKSHQLIWHVAGWYEVPGNIADLPAGITILTEEVVAATPTTRARIRLSDREEVLKTLRATL